MASTNGNGPPATRIPITFACGVGSSSHLPACRRRWQGQDAKVIDSCTLLTTEANPLVRPIHERMPVIVKPADFEAWLNTGVKDPALIQGLLRPYPEEEMEAFPVSRWVNDPKHDDPRCVEPVA